MCKNCLKFPIQCLNPGCQVDGLDFVIGPEILDCFKIAPTVLSLLTRNFGVRIPDLYDEIVYSFQELIPTTENGGLYFMDLSSLSCSFVNNRLGGGTGI